MRALESHIIWGLLARLGLVCYILVTVCALRLQMGFKVSFNSVFKIKTV